MIGRMDGLKIAFPTEGDKGLDDRISQHFGRARYYTIVEIEDGKINGVWVAQNPLGLSHEPGVLPLFLKERGISVLVCGGIGKRALELFERMGIKVYPNYSGRVAEVLESFIEGMLNETPNYPIKDRGCRNCG